MQSDSRPERHPYAAGGAVLLVVGIVALVTGFILWTDCATLFGTCIGYPHQDSGLLLIVLGLIFAAGGAASMFVTGDSGESQTYAAPVAAQRVPAFCQFCSGSRSAYDRFCARCGSPF